MISFDQYFTPHSVARRLALAIDPFDPKSVVDSNCGQGELLSALQETVPTASLSGIDIDNSILRTLSKRQPSWRLVHGDALKLKTWEKLKGKDFCAALLNPPFSARGLRTITVQASGANIQASPALAHVLTTIEQAQPRVIAAILPESSASSYVDGAARAAIGRSYSVEILERLNSSTFPGATVNSFIVRMVRLEKVRRKGDVANPTCSDPPLKIVRGGLPVFQKVTNKKGLKFIHSTHLRPLARGVAFELERVLSINRGVIAGDVVLFPRVGLPLRGTVCALKLTEAAQLSDCVFGVECRSPDESRRLSELISSRFDDFCEIYQGTGAKFATTDRVRSWFSKNWIS